jgi:hypothetical protein
VPISVDEHARPQLWYRRIDVMDPRRRCAANVFVLEATLGRHSHRGRAVLFDHRDRCWTFDPNLVAQSLGDQINPGRAVMTAVDRSTAEAAAREFDQVLPSEDELHRMMAEGAAALYG